MNPPLFRARRRPALADDRLLPLINVVLLLLIFFLLAGRLAVPEPFPVEPPVSQGSQGPATGSADETVLHLGHDGALALNGSPIALDDLPGALAAGPTPAWIHLKADGRAEALLVAHVLDRLRAGGVETVRLVTVTAGGG